MGALELHYTVVADETVIAAVSVVANADDAQTQLESTLAAAGVDAGISLGTITSFTPPSAPVSYTTPTAAPTPAGNSDTSDNSGVTTFTSMSLLGMSLVAGSIIV